MSHNEDQNGAPVTDIMQCIEACGISPEDYDDLIQALFLAAPKDPSAHAETKFDSKGSPISTTSVSRSFDGVALVAEERGAVYAVWVNKIDEKGGTNKVVGFALLPWGQR